MLYSHIVHWIKKIRVAIHRSARDYYGRIAFVFSHPSITGYQIQYSTNSKFTSGNKTATVKGYSKVSRKITGLKAKKKYFVRIRAYMKVSAKAFYSPWSKAKSAKTK